jgi:diguanylate cyclase (GGDEF)-like protein/PAS domain S-box-containing protein
MDSTNDSVVLVNRTTMRYVAVNATASQMLGYSRAELFELGPVGVLSISRERLEELYDAIIAGQGRTATLETAYRKDGSAFPVEVYRQAQQAGPDWVIVAVTRDITEHIESEGRLEHLAHFDTLTGLLNRKMFCDVLTKTLVYASATGETVAVVYLDLDNFKNVNDAYDLGIGDELLIQVADRLVECVRERDTVGRLGGDEFALILTMLDSRDDAGLVAEKIQTAFLEPFCVDGHEINVTASIGVTMHPEDAADPDTLLRYADTAMYQVKKSGRDAFQFFTSAMNTEVWRRLELEMALRHAFKNAEFVLHFQPKVALDGGQVVGLEAVLCWDRPGWGLVPSSEFMYSLEESGLILDVGRWGIAQVCHQIREWARQGIDPVQVSVNVSERQLVRGDLEEDVLLSMEIYEVPPRMLQLELSETSLMKSTERTIVILQNLHAAGVQICVDDFGTGHSGPAYLRGFPIDSLKIDRSFIHDLTRSSDADAVTLAMIRLGHSLDVEVVAEGVETAPQLAYLRSHHCDQIQGSYFSPPLPVSEIELLLRGHHSLPTHNDPTTIPRPDIAP